MTYVAKKGNELKKKKTLTKSNYLEYGLFLTDFFPYFLHLYPSSIISSCDLVLNVTLGLTSTVFSFITPLLRFLSNQRIQNIYTLLYLSVCQELTSHKWLTYEKHLHHVIVVVGRGFNFITN